jgi:epsilon-lactone hydrolase
LESIPIASVGRVKVISIDYRLAPEYTFPAASEDVAVVYREVLKRYKPKNIGLYGCSAGSMLTAESIAWFQRAKLPLPGAIGMFCAGASSALDADTGKFWKSDSGYITGALVGTFDLLAFPNYFKGTDLRSPVVSPGDYDDVMAKFPPSLLISGTRDMALSSVLATHAQLVRLGVAADLHVWEGMNHAFQFYPALPESREAYRVIVSFFDSHLGTTGKNRRPQDRDVSTSSALLNRPARG